jgi:hypothetical protein
VKCATTAFFTSSSRFPTSGVTRTTSPRFHIAQHISGLTGRHHELRAVDHHHHVGSLGQQRADTEIGKELRCGRSLFCCPVRPLVHQNSLIGGSDCPSSFSQASNTFWSIDESARFSPDFERGGNHAEEYRRLFRRNGSRRRRASGTTDFEYL